MRTLPAQSMPKAAWSAVLSRSRLKHSWLENEVLNKSTELVAALHEGPGWPALPGFLADAELAAGLADVLVDGFSPARLVEANEALARLPDERRDALSGAVHAAYLNAFDAKGAAVELRGAASLMKDALTVLLMEWEKPHDPVVEERLRTAWGGVLEKAERLRAVLDALPRGIVLP